MRKMKNRNKIFSNSVFFLILFICLHVAPAHAADGLSITEIMYDLLGSDTNREWIEIYNDSSTAIDLADHFLLTDGAGTTHHSLTPQNGSVVAPGAYAVIVQNIDSFKIDYPNYTGMIFDSSWQGLTATAGKTILIVDDKDVSLADTTYIPVKEATNLGNSLQKTSANLWIAAVPTPGSATVATTTAVTDTTDTTQTTSTASSGISSNNAATVKPVLPAHTQVFLSVPELGTVGIPVPISVKIIGTMGESRFNGAFHFAFGDGTAVESTSIVEPLSHIYDFPGSYVVTLEYRSNYYLHDPDVVSRAIIDVSTSAVVISAINPDGSITLSNSGKFDADISNWILETQSGLTLSPQYHFPSGMILLAGKTVTISPKVLGFTATSKESVRLLLPSGTLSAVSKTDTALPVTAVIKPELLSEKVTTGKTQVDLPKLSVDMPISIASPNPAPNFSDKVSAQSQSSSRSILPFILGLVGVIVAAFFALRHFKVFSLKPEEVVPAPSVKSETEIIADNIRIIE